MLGTYLATRVSAAPALSTGPEFIMSRGGSNGSQLFQH